MCVHVCQVEVHKDNDLVLGKRGIGVVDTVNQRSTICGRQNVVRLSVLQRGRNVELAAQVAAERES